MKVNKLIISILVIIFAVTISANLFAQEDGNSAEGNIAKEEAQAVETADEPKEVAPDSQVAQSNLEILARKLVGSGLVDVFIQGGFTMWPILVLFLWGIGTIIWKIIVLIIAKINVSAFLDKLIPLIENGEYKEAAELCNNAKGPVASILHAGLLKADHGAEAVEKSMESAGVLEMAYLEKGFVALGTAISLGPMFGFFGTLIGMIQAFDAIAKAGEVDPTIVASGIKVALITSAAGLAIAIPVQFFNNIFTSWVDGMIIDMQTGSEKVIETLALKE
ncbi:MAG: MotA/TolQ/ExbB proton channel family protein [Candidatus Cloacimonadota bacterium]|nr:MotA/TolQ/ExbB proton channel family protein [Candidatus Cloacimonadota bacterium]